MTVYDTMGAKHTVALFFVKTATAGEWRSHATLDGDTVTTDGDPSTEAFAWKSDFRHQRAVGPYGADAGIAFNRRLDTINKINQKNRSTKNIILQNPKTIL